MKELSWGNYDPNKLELKGEHVNMTPVAGFCNGSIKVGMRFEIAGYSIEDALVQMIEDYGKDELIKRINEL